MFRSDHAYKKSITRSQKIEYFDIVLSMHNLLEFSDNYSMKTGSFWNCYRKEVIEVVNKNNKAANYRINNSMTKTSKYFENKIIGSTTADNNTLDTEIIVPLKYLINVWRSLGLPLTKCQIELHFSLLEDCLLSEISRILQVRTNSAANPTTDCVKPTQTTGATFQINSINLYVLVVTLSVNDK